MPLAAPEALKLLLQAHQQNRLAHAYLLSGPRGSGKRALARELCGRILGGTAEAADSHPDLHSLEPESKSRQLSIAQIRDLEQKLQMRSLRGGKKFALLHDADRLGGQAANAFLKTLEEPPPGTHLLLLTEHPEQLLETILSRCVEVSLRATERPAREPAEQALIGLLERFFRDKKTDLRGGLWLAQSFQALLQSSKDSIQETLDSEAAVERKQYKDVVDSKWFDKREDFFSARTQALYLGQRGRLLEILEAFWTDALLCAQGRAPLHVPECTDTITALAAKMPSGEMFQRIEAVTRLREHLSMSGVNEALALEYGFLSAFAPESSAA
jgi:DNA polymerase-3 subunit delta'